MSDSRVTSKPTWSPAQAERIAESHFQFRGVATELPSESDQNFRIEAESGRRVVLKVANPTESKALLELQNLALKRLSSHATLMETPTVHSTASGEEILWVDDPTGRSEGPLAVRLVSWVDGVPLAQVSPHDGDLLCRLGAAFGELSRQLAPLEGDAANRPFQWDLQSGLEVVARHRSDLKSERRVALFGQLEPHLEPIVRLAERLPTQLIHGDGNDYNIIVSRQREQADRLGLIDFGDIVHSWRVAELAILLAYAMLGKRDPLATAEPIVAGFHAQQPLSEEELEALLPLVTLRLMTSVSLAAYQRRLMPENEYLSVTEAPAWELLQQLSEIHPQLAHCCVRRAAGLEPHPRGERLRRWIEREGAAAKPMVNPDPKRAGVLLDCSIGSLDLEGVDPRDAADFSRRVARHLEDVGSEVGIGRYDEPRSLYASDQFSAEGEEARERRTIHLGVDLFQPAGSPVFAPYDGVVHSFHDNDLPLDYGPTILLEHQTDVGPLYSLYGHLSKESLEGLSVGQPFAAGERLATLGDIDVNGGWPPHLHFQWVVDPLGERGNFPGVARPSLRSVWNSLSPDPSPTVGVDLRCRDASTTAERLKRRARSLPPSMSLSYREPLTILRGVGTYLFDEAANGYLDGVNNVCHVGHARPEVVRAASRQMSVLNTNTRYLHDEILRYSERLLSWMPKPLEVCFFVNSGSEANELALRLARQATQKVGRIAITAGYHGNTASLIDVSSYKCEGEGGAGVPEGVAMLPLPDPYRGLYRGSTAESASRYASHLDAAISELESFGGAGSLLAEAWSGCGGQIVPPPGWMGQLFKRAQAQGIVCIADEVQTGFGRIGSDRWAFEQQRATPDIVTLGKPIGNGHPLGAVVTTRAIADSFHNGMEFFNTFGGNPVSCSVGNVVLELLERDRLQEHAATVGERLLAGFRELASTHPALGDVRGSGFFLGLEMVDDPTERKPSPFIASYVVERMKQFGVLLSTDGPQHNVIKFKPPMLFSEGDADWLLHALGRVLQEDLAQCKN